METSVSLLGRLAGALTDGWRRLHDLYQPLLRAWIARAGVLASDVDDVVQDVLLVVFREIAGFECASGRAFYHYRGQQARRDFGLKG
jgi:DNA-directed RNA polymerase specialized sigma24 family protein